MELKVIATPSKQEQMKEFAKAQGIVRSKQKEQALSNQRAQWTMWTIVTVVAVLATAVTIVLITQSVNNTNNERERTKQTKVAACRSIEDESTRTLCIQAAE